MLDKVFRKNIDIVARKVAGEMILVPITGNVANMQHIFSLDAVADFIWSQLDGVTPLKEIIRRVTEEFEVDQEVAAQDCLEFISSLKEHQLIEEIAQ